jgi:prepilin-type N-terminal cleavage/methylation domain-containing protein
MMQKTLQRAYVSFTEASRDRSAALHKSSRGFTIIEVLIVLAIAGLILLIVFLAVPALQRNGRDATRKKDISRILGAAQEVVTNNGGQVSSLTTANVTAAVGTFGFYTAGPTVTAMAAGVVSGSGLNATTVDTTTLYTAAVCDGATGKAISGAARQIAIAYKIESGGGTLQCTST